MGRTGRATGEATPRRVFATLLAGVALALAWADPGQAVELALSADENPVHVTRDAIDATERTLDVVVYKFDVASLRKAVERALARGVVVRILADRDEAREKDSHVRQVEKAGASVRRWRRGKLHAKFTVLDGEQVLSGSFNWTDSARRENMELLLRFSEPGDVKGFQELFERLWDRAEER